MKEYRKKLPNELTLVPREEWGHVAPRELIEVWRSKRYLVQIYDMGGGVTRLSINRTSRNKGQWADKMTWDELQEIKGKVGYGDAFAVEIYPQDRHVVNVANMRHLWILPFPLSFAWTNEPDAGYDLTEALKESLEDVKAGRTHPIETLWNEWDDEDDGGA